MKTLDDFKIIIKTNAKVISKLKTMRKPKNFSEEKCEELISQLQLVPVKYYLAYGITYFIRSCKYYNRINHIAYSLLKGKKYEVIEKPKEENELTDFDWTKIKEIQSQFKIIKREVENGMD